MKHLILITILFNIVSTAVAYTPRTAEEYRAYSKLQKVNPYNNQKEVLTFKNYYESNEQLSEKYYCLVDSNKRAYGYVVFRNTFGRRSYLYETDNYSYWDRIKCLPNVDQMPVVHSWNDIK